MCARSTADYGKYLLAVQEQPGFVDELMTDPTLRRTQDLTCPNCGHSEYVACKHVSRTRWLTCFHRAVLFQDQSKRTFNSMWHSVLDSFSRLLTARNDSVLRLLCVQPSVYGRACAGAA